MRLSQIQHNWQPQCTRLMPINIYPLTLRKDHKFLIHQGWKLSIGKYTGFFGGMFLHDQFYLLFHSTSNPFSWSSWITSFLIRSHSFSASWSNFLDCSCFWKLSESFEDSTTPLGPMAAPIVPPLATNSSTASLSPGYGNLIRS